MSVDDEAPAFRLHDVERLQWRAEIIAELRLVVHLRHRHRNHAVVVDAQHGAGLDVDDGIQAADRMGVEIFVLAQPQPAERVREIAAFLARNAEIAGRPRIDADHAHVGDAALGAGGDEVWMRTHHSFDG